MVIKDPIKISIAEPAGGAGKSVVIEFSPEFQSLEAGHQGTEFQNFLEQLGPDIRSIDQQHDRNRAGMLIFQQFAEQLFAPIMAGELALEETLTVQIGREAQAGALVGLLQREIRPEGGTNG